VNTLPIDKLESLKANVHPRAHGAVADWEQIDWHRDQAGSIDSDVPHSSQAFCISVWGSLVGHTKAIGLGPLRRAAGLGDSWMFLDEATEIEFEYADAHLLNERGYGKPTNIDAMMSFDGHVVAVESKLTEGFGSCSQVLRGACTGVYEPGSDLKTRSGAPCRLQVADGRRTPRKYWEVMEQLCIPDTFAAGEPCIYSGAAYQVMRNIALSAEMGRRTGRQWHVLFAFPSSAKHASAEAVEAVVGTLTAENQERVAIVDYDRVASEFQQSDTSSVADLGAFMSDRLQHVT